MRLTLFLDRPHLLVLSSPSFTGNSNMKLWSTTPPLMYLSTPLYCSRQVHFKRIDLKKGSLPLKIPMQCSDFTLGFANNVLNSKSFRSISRPTGDLKGSRYHVLAGSESRVTKQAFFCREVLGGFRRHKRQLRHTRLSCTNPGHPTW